MKYDEIPRTSKRRLEEASRIGSQLQILRKAVGMTQKEAALRSGLSRSTAVLIEAGDERRTLTQVLRYLDAISPQTTFLDLLQDNVAAVKNMKVRNVPQRIRGPRRASSLSSETSALGDNYDF